MRHIELSPQALHALGDKIKTRFSNTILERGLAYYRQGRVGALNAESADRVSAEVAGTSRYRVLLVLDHFHFSQCTCPYEGYCKHMAAVFFALYASGNQDPAAWLHGPRLWPPAAPPRAGAAGRRERLDIALQRAPESWRKHLDPLYKRLIAAESSSVHVDLFFIEAFQVMQAAVEHWEREIKDLYTVFVILYLMRKADDLAVENPFQSPSYYLASAVKEIVRRFENTLCETEQRVQPEEMFRRFRACGETIISLLRESTLEAKNGPVPWLQIYRMLWRRILYHPQWVEPEMLELESRDRQPLLAPEERDRILMMRIHFDMILERDGDALRKFKQCDHPNLHDIADYLKLKYEKRDWDPLLNWLRALAPLMGRSSKEQFNLLMKCWFETSKNLALEDELTGILAQALPRSYYYYTKHLLDMGKYKQWADFHLLNGISPFDIHPADLKAVEAKNAGFLLPLYHQAIERSIVQKNRPAYKNAVKLLKKLKDCYQNIDQSFQFKQYVNRLMQQTVRLRAFQEEMKRGKLIL